MLLQGGIASGKSTVASMLAARGAEVLDCDRIAHDVLEEPEGRAEVRAAFGPDVLDAAGRVDRSALAEVVFADPDALRRLEAIVHPRVRDRVQERLAANRTPDGERRRVVVVDAAVAEKMQLTDHYDLRVFVAADAGTRRRRAADRGWDADELERREARQRPLRAKQDTADFVVENDGDLSEAESHVERFWSEHVEPRL